MDASTGNTILRRFSAFVDLTAGEAEALRALPSFTDPRDIAERITIEGDEPSSLFLLHEGWVLSSVNVTDGGRQVVKVHRPGDVMGLSSLPFMAAMESLTALTPSKVSTISLDRVGALFTNWPRLGAVLFLLAQEESAALTARLVSLGRLDAKRGFAALLLAMREADPADGGNRVYLLLTQTQLGDVLGLSTVHINRVVGALQQDGFIHHGRFVYEIIDLPRLQAFVGLPPRSRGRNLPWLPEAR